MFICLNKQSLQMKKIIFSFLLFCSTSLVMAQNSISYFKDIPKNMSDVPQWAQLMYSENPRVSDVNQLYADFYKTHPFVKNIHTQNYKYWLKTIEYLIGDDGYIHQKSAIELYEEINAINARKSADIEPSRTNPLWQCIGPFDTYVNNGSLKLRPTQTNIQSMAVAPSNHDIMYAGSDTGGGIFKSIDHGLNWTYVSLDYPIDGASDIKIHPTNPDIVYLSRADDIYKTIDGGVTWQLNYVLSGNNAEIEQFYIHRTQPNIVYAATSNGLLKTIDNGATWVNIFNKRCWDIVPHPTNPDIIYLSVNNPIELRAEIYKSTDNGANWVLKDNLWYTPSDMNYASDAGCKIGVTPADPERVYAGLIGNSKAGDFNWIGIYYSLNGGDSWVNPDGIDGGPYVAGSDMNTNWFVAGYGGGYQQGWYNFDLDVSHVDPDRLWVGTIWSCESANRGANIEYIRGTRNLEMHADVQDIDVVGNEIWYTSDGGINYSNDEMQSVEVRNTGISGSTYWGFTQGWNKDIMTGGRYHNGNAVFNENYGIGSTLFLGGAEAATGYINPLKNNTMYFSDIQSQRTPDQLTTTSTSFSSLSIYPNEDYVTLNSSEIEFHPNYSNYLYLGKSNVFYKSINGGLNFDTLFTFNSTARVLEFEISRSNPTVIYCLVKDNNIGSIFKSIDGGNTFNQVTAIPSNNLEQLDLSLDPENENNLWISTRRGANGQKVYQSLDGGQTWVNKTTIQLDGQKIQDILYQGGTNNVVYIITETNSFYWDATTSNWIDYSDGLPYSVRPLYYRPFYRDQKLRFAGDHGIMEALMAVTSTPVANPITENEIISCTRDSVQFEDYSILNHENATWSWSFNPQPAYISDPTARNPIVVFGQNGTFDVTLTITDGVGNTSTKTIEDMVTVESQCEPDSIPGSSIRMQAAGDYVNIPDLMMDQTTSVTFSAWIKPKGLQASYTGIVMNNGPSAGFNFRSNNKLGYHWPGGSWAWESDLVVDSSKWSHVAMVVTPTTVTLYVNGIKDVHTATLTPANIHEMKIGSYNGYNDRNFKGEIDEVCIWDRALSQEEIRELRHLTRTGINPFTDDLVAYYQFNETSINSFVMDRIGTKHATLNGNAEQIVSTAPVGGGESHRLTVSAPGTITFGTTEMEMIFDASTPNGEIVATRLHLLPDSLLTPNPSPTNYWIVNNYGTVDFDPLVSLKLKPSYGSANGLASDCKLYTRTDNEHLNNWVEECSATNLNGGSFNYSTSCGLSNFSQFFVQSSDTSTIFLNTNNLSLDQTIAISPNPTSGIVIVTAKDQINSIEVLDQLGKRVKIIYALAIGEEVTIDLSNYSNGIYTFVMHTDKGVDKARIVKQ